MHDSTREGPDPEEPRPLESRKADSALPDEDDGVPGSQPFTGRPRAGSFGMLDAIHNRVDLMELLSHVLRRPQEECEFLVRLAIDEGPITMRATTEMTIVALALIARNVVIQPKEPEQVYPIYLEQMYYLGPPHHHPDHEPPHQHYSNPEEVTDAGTLPLAVPVGIPEKLLRFSYANNGLAVPAVGGPNHERAGLVLISNLVYQIWQATGEELP